MGANFLSNIICFASREEVTDRGAEYRTKCGLNWAWNIDASKGTERPRNDCCERYADGCAGDCASTRLQVHSPVFTMLEIVTALPLTC